MSERNLTERYTIRFPQGEKVKLEAVANAMQTHVATIVRILINSNNTLDGLLKAVNPSDDIIKQIQKIDKASE
jgi:hypothetical protein